MRRLPAAAAALTVATLVGATAEPSADPPAAGGPHGRLVLGLHPPERVAVLDVESGELVQRRLPGGTLCHGPLMVSHENVVFLGSSRRRPALIALELGLQRRVRVLDRGANLVLPSARHGALWLFRFRYDGRVPRFTGVREVAADGTVLFGTRRRPPTGYPMAASADGIVFEYRGRTRIWNPRSGALRAAPGFWMIAASGDRSAWCGEPCRRVRLEGPGGVLTGQRLPRGWSFNPGTGSLSADGALVAVAAYREHRPYRRTRIALVRTTDGSVELLRAPLAASRGELDWSPDGEWLYVAAAGRDIAAYRPSDGRVVTLPVRLSDEVIDLSAAG